MQMEYLRPLTCSILSERRALRPYGLLGGHSALPGLNLLLHPDGRKVNMGGKTSVQVKAGDRIRILTPGTQYLTTVEAIQISQGYNTLFTRSGALNKPEVLLTEMLFDLSNSQDAEPSPDVCLLCTLKLQC